jgi:hypothetical protein
MKVNMPDVMLPYTTINASSGWFFVMYQIFTQFFFLRLILAASFSNYKQDSAKKHRKRLAFKEVAYMKAFALLASDGDGRNRTKTSNSIESINDDAKAAASIVQQPRGRQGLKNLANVLVQSDGSTTLKRKVTLESWRKMMTVLRPDLKSNPWIFDLILVASCNNRIKTSEHFRGDNTSLHFREFCDCCHSVNLKVKRSVEKPSATRSSEQSSADAKFNCWNNFANKVTYLFEETYFEGVMQFFLAISSITAIVTASDKTSKLNEFLRVAQGTTAFLFTMVMLTTLIARGWKFWKKIENQICFLAMLAIIIVYILAYVEEAKFLSHKNDSLDSVLSVLYVVTVLRSLFFVKFHPAVIQTIDTIRLIMPMLGRIAVVFFMIMYSFVMIGSSLFEETLFENETVKSANMAYYSFHYTSLNFASFWSGLLMLHQCLLGPQFPIFVEAVAKAHGSWGLPVMYFGAYYVIVVVFVQNVVVAFILEAYMRQRGKTSERQGGRWAKLTLNKKEKTDGEKPTLSAAQKNWLFRMFRGLRVVLDNAMEAEADGGRGTIGDLKSSRGVENDEIIVFEFSRKPPHHELYDSVFYGDEMDPAKMKIKMNKDMTSVKAEMGGLEEEGLEDDDDEGDDDDDDDDDGGIDEREEGADGDGEEEDEEEIDPIEEFLEEGGVVKKGSTETPDVAAEVQEDGGKIEDVVEALQKRIVELESSEERLRQALETAMRRKKSILV